MAHAGGERPGLRVACILHHAALGGAGLAFLELLDGLDRSQLQVQAVLPSHGPFEELLRTRGVEQSVIPYRWWLDRGTPAWKPAFRTVWNVAMAWRLAVLLRRWKVDLVYTNTLTVAAGAIAARLLRLPHVWHVHELWGGETGFTFDLGERRSLGLVDRLSSLCVAISGTVASRLSPPLAEEKVRVVYQSVTEPPPNRRRAPRPPGAFVVLVLGAVFPVKRQEDAVAALAALAGDPASFELWLVGEEFGAYPRYLREVAAAGGVEGRVHFLGFQHDPQPFFEAADVVVSCCAVEPFGRATVEGMLAGKPVVAARGGGNLELVREDFNGLLYEAHDARSLAACLSRLARHPEECRRFGANGRRWARQTFSRERYAEEMTAILASLTGASSQLR